MENILKSVFQPIVNIKTNQVLYYESLARVKNDDIAGRHLKLLEAGESFGFIDLIDIAMLRKAITTAKNNPGIRIAVNISVMTIENSLGDLLGCAFQHYEVMNQIVFEITETIELRKREKMLHFLSAVRLLGAKVAIDDFGDGFANLDLVNFVQPDFVKLPKFIIEAALNKEHNVSMFINELLRRRSIEIIAEHIDSASKVSWLRTAGIDYAQGFHFGSFYDEENLSSSWDASTNIITKAKLTA